MNAPPPSPRERHRLRTWAEIKRIALRQLAERGPAALSLNAVAKQLGMSGPALYRYFASRDDLLTELVLDAYQDLGDALWAVVDASGADPAAVRMRAVAAAYRGWAVAHPHRYLLIFGTPLPGYHPPDDRTTVAAQRLFAALIALLPEPGPDPHPARSDDPLDRACAAWAERIGVPARPGRLLRFVIVFWTRLHGVLSLELEGHFVPVLPDPELIYAREVDDLVAPWEDGGTAHSPGPDSRSPSSDR